MYIHIDPDSRLGKAILVIGLPIFVAFLWLQSQASRRAYRSLNWPVANGAIEIFRLLDQAPGVAASADTLGGREC